MNRFYSTSFRIFLGVCSGWVLSVPVMAAAPAPVFDPAVLDARDQEAKALKDEGKAIRAQADTQLEIDRWNCYSKILVNHCIDKAKERLFPFFVTTLFGLINTTVHQNLAVAVPAVNL